MFVGCCTKHWNHAAAVYSREYFAAWLLPRAKQHTCTAFSDLVSPPVRRALRSRSSLGNVAAILRSLRGAEFRRRSRFLEGKAYVREGLPSFVATGNMNDRHEKYPSDWWDKMPAVCVLSVHTSAPNEKAGSEQEDHGIRIRC